MIQRLMEFSGGTGVFKQQLTHQEVIGTTARVQKAFTALVLGVLQNWYWVC